jgi:hypothetical protein
VQPEVALHDPAQHARRQLAPRVMAEVGLKPNRIAKTRPRRLQRLDDGAGDDGRLACASVEMLAEGFVGRDRQRQVRAVLRPDAARVAEDRGTERAGFDQADVDAEWLELEGE